LLQLLKRKQQLVYKCPFNVSCLLYRTKTANSRSMGCADDFIIEFNLMACINPIRNTAKIITPIILKEIPKTIEKFFLGYDCHGALMMYFDSSWLGDIELYVNFWEFFFREDFSWKCIFAEFVLFSKYKFN